MSKNRTNILFFTIQNLIVNWLSKIVIIIEKRRDDILFSKKKCAI